MQTEEILLDSDDEPPLEPCRDRKKPRQVVTQLRRSYHHEKYVASAINFLTGIRVTNQVKTCSPSVVLAKSSYAECLNAKATPTQVAGLAEVRGRLAAGPLRERLNTAFAKRHPRLRCSLSELVNLREALFGLCLEKGLDCGVAVVAWPAFLTLVSLNAVTSTNRRLYMATTVLLAYKFTQDNSDVRGLLTLLKSLDSRGKLTPKEVLKQEFHVYALLKFDLIPRQVGAAEGLQTKSV